MNQALKVCLERVGLIFKLDNADECGLDAVLIADEQRNALALAFKLRDDSIITLPRLLRVLASLLVPVSGCVECLLRLYEFEVDLFQAALREHLAQLRLLLLQLLKLLLIGEETAGKPLVLLFELGLLALQRLQFALPGTQASLAADIASLAWTSVATQQPMYPLSAALHAVYITGQER